MAAVIGIGISHNVEKNPTAAYVAAMLEIMGTKATLITDGRPEISRPRSS